MSPTLLLTNRCKPTFCNQKAFNSRLTPKVSPPGRTSVATALHEAALYERYIDNSPATDRSGWNLSRKTYSGPNGLWLSQELPRLLSCGGIDTDKDVVFTRGNWKWVEHTEDRYILRGNIVCHNLSKHKDIFLPELKAGVRLLASSMDPRGCEAHIKVTAQHGKSAAFVDTTPRMDGYWSAFSVQRNSSTALEVEVVINGPKDQGPFARGISWQAHLADLQSALVVLDYTVYGAFGLEQRHHHIVLPLAFPERGTVPQLAWRTADNGSAWVLPVRTHLLCHMDDPLTVVQSYVGPLATQPGDTIVIAESALAIMQGRWRHYSSVHPGGLARTACKFFDSKANLSTSTAMQALIDQIGKFRVVLALIVGVLARLLFIRGMFYKVAGVQSRTVDDVTGTMAPYDKSVVLGPLHSQDIVNAIRERTGLEVAVADVNDTSRKTGNLEILAATAGVDRKALRAALLDNPAGNADQQTPLVLVRRI